jgi:hypothetical protein
MSQDFFSDLERELVAATGERRARIRRARQRRAMVASTALIALLAGGAGLAAAVVGGGAGGGRDGAPAGAPTARTTTATSAPPLSTRTRGVLDRQTVAILNATRVPGLGRGVANRLQNAGIKIGNVTNAAGQTRATTYVTYVPGHQDAALRVAALLDLSPSVISPAAKADRVLAGDTATVVVLVGSDQNSAPVP